MAIISIDRGGGGETYMCINLYSPPRTKNQPPSNRRLLAPSIFHRRTVNTTRQPCTPHATITLNAPNAPSFDEVFRQALVCLNTLSLNLEHLGASLKTINDLINAPYGKVYPVILTEGIRSVVLKSLREDLESLQQMKSAGTGLTKEFVQGVDAEIREIKAQLAYYSGPAHMSRHSESRTTPPINSCSPCSCVVPSQCRHAGAHNA